MDTSSLLGIAGLVATIVFGAASVYLYVRHRYPGRLSFIFDREIALFDDIVGSLSELSVLFNGVPVAENLILVKAFLLNIGERDLTPTMVHERLTARLPTGYSWKTAKVVAVSPQARAAVRVAEPAILEFDLGFFRRNDYLEVEAVAEAPSQDVRGFGAPYLIQAAIAFDHRIADTGPVKIRNMPAQIERNSEKLSILLAIGVGLIIFNLFFTNYLKPGHFSYFKRGRDGHVIQHQVRATLDGHVWVRELPSGRSQQLTLQQFEDLHLQRRISPLPSSPIAILAGFAFLMALLELLFPLLANRVTRKLQKRLGRLPRDASGSARRVA